MVLRTSLRSVSPVSFSRPRCGFPRPDSSIHVHQSLEGGSYFYKALEARIRTMNYNYTAEHAMLKLHVVDWDDASSREKPEREVLPLRGCCEYENVYR